MLLSELIKKENNAFDIYRLAASVMVIWGHAYALLPNAAGKDFIQRLTGFTYSGAVAVVLFFFLSGLLVSNSLINGANAFQFTVNRVARIWPGLAASVAVVTFFIGPLVTKLSASNYFSESSIYTSFITNVTLGPLLNSQIWDLPGVFKDHNYQATNGSLWTIPFEIYCYAFVLFVYLLFSSSRRVVALWLLVTVSIGTLYPELGLVPEGEIRFAIFAFALGAVCALNSSAIKIDGIRVVIFSTLAIIFRGTEFAELAFYLAAITLALWLSSLRIFRLLRLPGDYSFGVYLYGFPVQQALIAYNFSESTLVNQVATIAISLVFGYLSWNLIENPGQKGIRVLAVYLQKSWAKFRSSFI